MAVSLSKAPEPFDPAYICKACSEAFAPENGDWPELRAMHKSECVGATFTKTTIEKAF